MVDSLHVTAVAEAANSRPFSTRAVAIVAVFTTTIFLSSSLLFFVQPMFAKMILPRLGGTPAVWNTCMVFFQACLLAGYAYAHVSTRMLGVRRQSIGHLILMLAPLLVLPLAIPAGWTPPTTINPVLAVLLLLAVTVGPPFVVVSASSPLLQKWFARTGHPSADDPYFLYAAGNLGSMLALLAYPLVLEPGFRLAEQARGWTLGYGSLIVLMAMCAVLVWRGATAVHADLPIDRAVNSARGRVSWLRRLHWIALSFVPSSYLLGVTTYISSDVAAVPLLWVVPLALYLLSFILVFLQRPFPPHRLMVFTLPFAVAVLVAIMTAQLTRPVGPLMLLHLAVFFIVAMVCHGELARRRPAAEHLTEFYLWMSTGGVLGGAFNALLAPVIFQTPVEYAVAIALAALLLPATDEQGPVEKRTRRVLLDLLCFALLVVLTWLALVALTNRRPGPAGAILMTAGPAAAALLARSRPIRFGLCIAAVLGATAYARIALPDQLLVRRSYFGVNRVMRIAAGTDLAHHELSHGTTIHGYQPIDPISQRPIDPDEAAGYYHPDGPIGQLSHLIHDPESPGTKNIAIIGLGTGTLASSAGPGVRMTYYEIDPVVRDIAEDTRCFTYLSAARERGAAIDVILGDARLTIAREAADESIDLLVLDAFTGDAIPVHLLTTQAMELYRSKMKPETGLIVIHLSNHFLDLRPVVGSLAEQMGWTCYVRDDRDRGTVPRPRGKERSTWALLARDQRAMGSLKDDARWTPVPSHGPTYLWTDDFSNIVRVLK